MARVRLRHVPRPVRRLRGRDDVARPREHDGRGTAPPEPDRRLGNDPGGPDNAFSSALALRTLLLSSTVPRDPATGFLARFLMGGPAGGDAEMLAPGAAAYGRELVLRDSGVVTVAAVVGALGQWLRS